MDYVNGMVVFAKAGRDAGRFYMVVGMQDGYPLIADGKRRKLEGPKRKNPIHLQKTNKILPFEDIHSNSRLRRELAQYNTIRQPDNKGR